MSYAIRFSETGGPDVLRYENVSVPNPGENEVRIRQSACGVNYIDTYHRTGLYPVPLPSGIGVEGAGVVEAVGSAVVDFNVGDRVAYADRALGGYAHIRNISAERLIKLPDSISFETAAAMMIRGLTAQYLLRRTYKVNAGDIVLIHAAAGGVGLIACQWAKALGATVIGTVGSTEKADLAKMNGCDHPIIYTQENVVNRVRDITGGAGAYVVYDSIGKNTFMDSLNCLKPLGMMVTYGNTSGPVPAFEPSILSQKGSLFLTRPTLWNYAAKREDLMTMSHELFSMVTHGKIKITIGKSYPLKDAAEAHRDLESHKTTGSTILIP